MDPGQRLQRFRDDAPSRTSSSRKFRGTAEGIVRDPCIYATTPFEKGVDVRKAYLGGDFRGLTPSYQVRRMGALMNKETLTLIVDHIRDLAPGVRHIGFRRQDGKALSMKPGQFITLLLPHEGDVVRRNYSIATIPTSSGPEVEIDLIEIALTYVNHGFASERLFSIKVGETLDMIGPSGRLLFFHEHKPPRRLILVATGTGVSPYRAMLPQLARFLSEDEAREIVLLFGIRTPQHVLYHDDFAYFAGQNPRFSFHCCYSREMPAKPAANDHTGYVQTFLQTFPLKAEEDIVYLCGNPAMVDEAYTHLKACQFSIHTVRREKYLSAR